MGLQMKHNLLRHCDRLVDVVRRLVGMILQKRRGVFSDRRTSSRLPPRRLRASPCPRQPAPRVLQPQVRDAQLASVRLLQLPDVQQAVQEGGDEDARDARGGDHHQRKAPLVGEGEHREPALRELSHHPHGAARGGEQGGSEYGGHVLVGHLVHRHDVAPYGEPHVDGVRRREGQHPLLVAVGERGRASLDGLQVQQHAQQHVPQQSKLQNEVPRRRRQKHRARQEGLGVLDQAHVHPERCQSPRQRQGD
mmetsp:Transcript_5294/g.13518  ORF Transcript_5294/g.13518 Transcript_5294/m.13518 type:complete len:250 (-) Transcript_5294:473-1222(-)